ncbi:40S ribosomal protein S13 [Linum grandiflorum]
MKKAVAISKHLERNRKDKDSKFRLNSNLEQHPQTRLLLQEDQEAPPCLEIRIDYW